MNYDKSDLPDPLLKINLKNFGAPKSGSKRPLSPGIRKRRYDDIVPVRTAKKTFEQFTEQLVPRKPKYLRDIRGKKVMGAPLDLRSVDQKEFNVKYQADGLIGKKKTDTGLA